MRPFTLEVRTFEKGQYGTANLRAMHTECPHILVTESIAFPGHYRLTHAATGMAIAWAECSATRDAFGLFDLAAEIGTMTNWSRPAQDLHKDEALTHALKRAFMAAPIEWMTSARDKRLEAASTAALLPNGE